MTARFQIASATVLLVAVVGCAPIYTRNPVLGDFTFEVRGDTTIYREAYRSGGTRSETPLVGDKADGFVRLFHPDGRLEKRTAYLGGQAAAFGPDSLAPGEWSYDSSGLRSPEEILKVIRWRTPDLAKPYDALMAQDKLSGKVTLVLAIRPDGYLHYLVPIGDTTRRPRFVVAVLNTVRNWKFVAVPGRNLDIVTIPFTFRP